MTKGSRQGVLDEVKRAEILAIVSVGCSRRVAARYVGCAPSTIWATARRDERFGRELARAEQKSQLGLIKNIRDAAKKAQYWRAAAWALERLNPEDFAPRGPEVVTVEQMHALMDQLAQVLVEHVPIAAHRKQVLRCVEGILADLPG